jgi:DNA-binding CsgD family transcriptional regulator
MAKLTAKDQPSFSRRRERAMDSLRRRYQHLCDLIDLLYGAKDSADMASVLFDGLQGLVPFGSAMFLPIDRPAFEMREGYCQGCAAADMRLYLSRYAFLDPFVSDPACLNRLNEAVRLSALPAAAQLRSTELGDFCGRLPYCHAVSVLAGWCNQPLAAIRLYRDGQEHDFSTHELEIMSRLAPHVAKAMYLRELAMEQSPDREAGLVVFGADRRVIYWNEAAADLLPGIALDSVLAAAQGGSMWFKTASGLSRLKIVHLTPASLLVSLAGAGGPARNGRSPDDAEWLDALDRSITVVAIEPFSSRHAITTRLERSGLSRREVEVAAGVMGGLSNAKIAQQLFIDEKTVKDHLQHIYEKIRVHSRAELISKILGLDTEFACWRGLRFAKSSA